MDVAVWLRGLGLGQYEGAFRENGIDGDVLPNLTADDLKELGITVVGHRRKLLSAIASLDQSLPASGMAAAAPPASPLRDQHAQGTAERRHLTVVFCDLVGSTALSARLDPEDMREIVGAYHRSCAEQITKAGGFVAKYMGDGVLAYFGYPNAHEDDAERAVLAGLAVVEAVPKLKTAAGAPLQVRIGIATGLVVVGDLIGSGEAQERGVVGDTPNLAARLQALAEPNMVVIADSARRLLGNLFELRDLGPQDLKGITGPARAWAALRASSVDSRFEALRTTGLTPLVGREEEFEALLRCWSRAKSGEGQVVLVSGEAGIGKSRLTAALLEYLAAESHTRLRYFCSPQHTDSALHPFIGQMERAAGLAYNDKPHVKLDKLDAALAQTSTLPEDAALLAEMLSLANDGRHPAQELTPEQRRQRTLAALSSQLAELARQQPVLMIFEDAHWADPTSLEVLGRTVDFIAAGLLFRQGTPPHASYLFKHALVQDAAYGTLLRGPRRSLHARIATAMEDRIPEIVETRPELLAHHFAEAKMAERAIQYWLRGGERASERSANIEAIAHLSNGLKLVETLPDTPQRVETEFALQMAIGGPLAATKGYAAPEVERTYLRARELCERLGRSSELFPVLRGLWNHYFTRGELLRGGDLAERLAVLAEEQGRSLQRALAHRSLGSTWFFLGRFSEAREQLDQAIAFDEAVGSGNRRAYISLYADSPGVIGRLHLSCIQWLLGFPEHAVATLEAGLALGEALATPSFHALALTFSAVVRQWRQEFEAARRQAEAAIAVAREHGLYARLAIGTICRGVALAHLGQHEEGIAEVHAGFACWHGTGARLYDPMWHGFTAEAHAATGQFDAAFAALDRATATAAATAQLFYQAELHRLRGAYYAARGERIEAEVWLKDAIKLARSQAAKSLELRAATSLARLWRAQGKCTEAHDLLAPVYGWFTEGFNTRDLQEAKALLDKLL